MSFDFDRVVPRADTASVKWDARPGYFGSADVLPMWVADMDFAAPDEVVQALAARAAHPVYGYTLYPDGLFDTLAGWLHQRHGWTIERDWVLWAPGVVPSLFAAVQAFAGPGEGVVLQPPVYHPFFSAITDTGRVIVENPLRLADGRYAMDLDHLERCAAAGARLLLLCSPHNPVGRVWRPDELRAVLDIARRHDMTVLSDEIHHDLVYPGERHHLLATLAGDPSGIVTAVAPSKTFNIPGLGLSALVVPDPERRAALKRVFGQLHVSASNPFSVAAFETAYRVGAPWLDALMAYLAGTRDFVLDFVDRRLPGIRAIRPEGTYLVWLDCRGLGLDDRALADFFVRTARVGMNPGHTFGRGGSGFMRLNVGAPRAVVAEALERIAAAVAGR
ncbi:putative C-S lyase [Parasulfuritortus cantonensis]|uniref:cysteine-S-conjugate beta-lyase n=1 Tax=Parasulfuritortus cantonensis TaxID=2528202 RepID=A0A4R1BCY6_9PROT|nr:PatB family C-S lyase [Parasulfuritortus cantonensis]TCJ14936.1 putative C-S lyase [Parasulfuritortus cantonensis]